LLMGADLGSEIFRVVDITVQHSRGTHACFTREPSEHRAQLQAFFDRTGCDYQRYNYLGEWHSHPSFEVLPSTVDIATMWSIVADPSVGAHFLVLLIVRLADVKGIEASATVFRLHSAPLPIMIRSDGASRTLSFRAVARWLRERFRA
jgi:hypothetical protein